MEFQDIESLTIELTICGPLIAKDFQIQGGKIDVTRKFLPTPRTQLAVNGSRSTEWAKL